MVLAAFALVFMCTQAGLGQDYHYGFTYPWEESTGTLGDGNLSFINNPMLEPSLVGVNTNAGVNEDWALHLERNQQQYAQTESLSESTVFNGSYRVEAFFNSDGLSDSADGTYNSRQGIVTLYSPTPSNLMLLIATYRDSGTGSVRLVLVYRKRSGSLSTVNGTTALNLNQWYHVEVRVDDQGNDNFANDGITVYLNGSEEIHVQGLALAYLDGINKIVVGRGTSTLRSFQGTLDEVLVSSELNEPSLLQTLTNAASVLTRTPGVDFHVDSSGKAAISYTAPFGGEHGVYFKDDLLLPHWIYKGELAVDDLDWSGEWFDSPSNGTGFYMVESTRTTKSLVPTVSDILKAGTPYFNPWDTTRWADWYDGSGRLTKPFDLDADIEFDDPGHIWSPDVSLLTSYTSILKLTGDQPVSIEGNGLIIDIRSSELASKSIADLYDDLGDDNYALPAAQIPHTTCGIFFDQQTGTPTASSVSGITFRGFQHAIASTHFNRMGGTITNCVFEFNDWALFARSTSRFLVEDNTIRRNIFGGVHCDYDSANWIFINNTFYDNNPGGVRSYADVVLDACRYHTFDNNQFRGTTQPSKAKNYFAGMSIYRNRGEGNNIKEDASSLHSIQNNVFDGGYHIAIDIAERTGYVGVNDLSLETRTYANENTFANNTFSNCVIAFHIAGNRNTLASNSYVNVEREVALHSVFYKNEGTLFDGEGNTDVWLWGDASDFSAYAAYLPYQLNGGAGRHIAQSNRLFFASSINGSPTFNDTTDGKIFIHEQSLLNGNTMQSVFNTGGTIRDIAVADFDWNAPGLEFAVIWNQKVSRISTANTAYADYYSIIIYDQSGKEIDRCGRSTLQWDTIAAGNFIEGLGWTHIDEEAEVAAVHSVAEDDSYPVYIFRRGYADAAVTNQSSASTPVADLAAERTAGSGYVSLAVARGTAVARLIPSSGSETPFCTLSSTPLAIQLGEFDGNHADGNELAALNGGSIAFYESGSSSPFLAGAVGSWSSFTAGEFDGDSSNGDELAVASATAVDGLYPIEYFDHTLTNAFKKQSHSVLSEQTRAMASGVFMHERGPDGYFRRGDGRASFGYEFQPRFETNNTGFSPDGQLVASAASVGFAASPFDFDGDGSVEDEQAVDLSHANNEYLQLDDSTGFSTPSGSYTVEAFFNAASLPAEQMPDYNARRGIFYWYNTTDIGSLYLVREADGELHLGAFIRRAEGFTSLLSPHAVQVGEWYHAMLKVIDQGNDGAATDQVELYLNGELVDAVDNLNLVFFTGGDLMRVGHSQQSTGPRSFDGLLDGVRIVSGTDAPTLIDEIPNAREVLGLSPADSVNDDHILVLPDRNDTSPVYWMHTDGALQEMRTVPVLR